MGYGNHLFEEWSSIAPQIASFTHQVLDLVHRIVGLDPNFLAKNQPAEETQSIHQGQKVLQQLMIIKSMLTGELQAREQRIRRIKTEGGLISTAIQSPTNLSEPERIQRRKDQFDQFEDAQPAYESEDINQAGAANHPNLQTANGGHLYGRHGLVEDDAYLQSGDYRYRATSQQFPPEAIRRLPTANSQYQSQNSRSENTHWYSRPFSAEELQELAEIEFLRVRDQSFVELLMESDRCLSLVKLIRQEEC